jgi:MSHA biogenesis protein MshJ
MRTRLIAYLELGRSRFESLTLRERGLTTGAVVAAVFFLLDSTLLAQQEDRRRQVESRIASTTAEIQRVGDETQRVAAKLAGHPAEKEEAKLLAMKQVIERAAPMLAEDAPELTRLVPLLRSMIAATPGIQIRSIRTIDGSLVYEYKAPATPDARTVTGNAPATGSAPLITAAGPAPSLYRYGVDIAVQGSFIALLPYLRKLETLPRQLLWGELNINVMEHPNASIRVVLYALSRQPPAPLQ